MAKYPPVSKGSSLAELRPANLGNGKIRRLSKKYFNNIEF